MATKKRILVVDDSAFMTTMLQNTLEAAGYDVSVAHDVQQTLLSMREEGIPDLLVLDVNLPDLQGDKACQAIRKAPACANLPIVFISGMAEHALADAAQVAGANGYLKKPFSPSSILRWVRDHAPLLEVMEEAREAELAASRRPALPEPPPTPAFGTPVLPEGILMELGRPMGWVDQSSGARADFGAPYPNPPNFGGPKSLGGGPAVAPFPVAPPEPPVVPPVVEAAPPEPPVVPPVVEAVPPDPPAAAPVVPAAEPPASLPEVPDPDLAAVADAAPGPPIPPVTELLDLVRTEYDAEGQGEGFDPDTGSTVETFVDEAPPGPERFVPYKPARPPPVQGGPGSLGDLIPVGEVDPLAGIGPNADAAAAATGPEYDGEAVEGGILIVEDSTFLRTVLADTLTTSGYDVALTATMGDCSALLGQFRPGLILMDVNLPDAQGDEACRLLKTLPESADLPVILMTSGPEDVLRAKAQAASANGYLRKPFTAETLVMWLSRQDWVKPGRGQAAASHPPAAAAPPSSAPVPAPEPEPEMEVVPRPGANETQGEKTRIHAILTKQLASEDPHVRAQAAYSLGERRSFNSLPVLRSALKDSSPEVLSDILWALGEMEDRDAVYEIEKLLRSDREAAQGLNVRIRAVEALGKIGLRVAIKTIAICLGEDRPTDERVVAIQALADLGDDCVREDLQRIMFEEESEIQALAKQALDKIQARTSAPPKRGS